MTRSCLLNVLSVSSCCFNEQLLRFGDALLQRTNSDPVWPFIDTALIFVFIKILKPDTVLREYVVGISLIS